jgi:hypothetical protein
LERLDHLAISYYHLQGHESPIVDHQSLITMMMMMMMMMTILIEAKIERLRFADF